MIMEIGPHYGWLQNEVRIPTRHDLETGMLELGVGIALLQSEKDINL